MSQVETEAKRKAAGDIPAAVWSPGPAARAAPRRRLRVVPALVTLVTMALAAGFGFVASFAGLLVSYHGNLPTGPAILLAAGLLFGISLVATSSWRRVAPMIGRDA